MKRPGRHVGRYLGAASPCPRCRLRGPHECLAGDAWSMDREVPALDVMTRGRTTKKPVHK